MKLNPQNSPQSFLAVKDFLLLTFAVILLDEFSKVIAQNNFVVSCNKGIAFGIGTEGKIMSAVALLLVYWILLHAKENILKLGLALIFVGGLSNLIDRLISGCVRDFITVFSFPRFNLADCVITIGVAFVLYFLVFLNKGKGYGEASEDTI